jgi:hypothetical protein
MRSGVTSSIARSTADLIFVAAWLVTFAAGFALGLIPSAVLRLSLLITGPLAAWIVYQVVNPEPGCTGECIGQLVLGILLVGAAVSWWAGLLAGMLCRWLMGRAKPKPTEYRT